MGVSKAQSRSWQDWLVDRAARGLIGAARLLPWRWRLGAMGWLTRRVIGPVAGYRRRILDNLAHVWPDLAPNESSAIAAAVLDNAGRTLIENYSTPELLDRAHAWEPEGPGLAALAEAEAAGRPVLLITAHFGNYEAARAALTVRGHVIGGLYRPMNNAFFNDHYVATMKAFGGPVFPRGRKGLAGFVKHLKGGGQGILLIDQYFADGALVDFLGKPAPTALSAAEMALKYDALLIPFYARRLANGEDFAVTLEAPVPHSTPEAMTQALTDSLAAQVRATPGQWFWVHRRWKPARQAKYFPKEAAAPRAGS